MSSSEDAAVGALEEFFFWYLTLSSSISGNEVYRKSTQ